MEMSTNPSDIKLPTAPKVGYDVGGYTVLPDVTKKKKEKVHRVLPDWLISPDIVHGDINNKKRALSEFKHLFSGPIYEKLEKNGLTSLFPVQWQVIPSILDSIIPGTLASKSGLPPRDICCSAPTGSGKTLAFVLPIVQALQHTVTSHIRALVILPVADLALQVYKVFLTYTEGTRLKVGLIIGQASITSEQRNIMRLSKGGEYESGVDILISTPGRLVDHINFTKGFDLSRLRFLVLDEVDRILNEVKQDWLNCVEEAVYEKRGRPQPLTAMSLENLSLPLQKLLFSATLTENPEKLEMLNLCQPRLFTSIAKDHYKTLPHEDSGEHFVGKFTTPESLEEYYTECRTPKLKPAILIYLLKTLKLNKALIFTKSQDTTKRLQTLLSRFDKSLSVGMLSGVLEKKKRTQMLKKFSSGKINFLVTTDVLARGIDVQDVPAIISYDCPSHLKTYIHRIGRTARAGRDGAAYTIINTKQISHFKQMIKSASKTVKPLRAPRSQLNSYLSQYQDILKTTTVHDDSE